MNKKLCFNLLLGLVLVGVSEAKGIIRFNPKKQTIQKSGIRYPSTTSKIGVAYALADDNHKFNYFHPDSSEIFVPEVFTPNGDGINDVLVINGIEKFPNAQLKIFNRWGNLVYESNGVYKNDWNGTNTYGVRIGGDKLPVGTYFYILEPNDPKNAVAPKKGYVYLQY
jgi:gliding motility-associated-like protein